MNIIAGVVLIIAGAWGDCILVEDFPYYFKRFEIQDKSLPRKPDASDRL